MDIAAVLGVLVKAEGFDQVERKVDQLDARTARASQSIDRETRKIDKAFKDVDKAVQRSAQNAGQAERSWTRFAAAPEKAISGLGKLDKSFKDVTRSKRETDKLIDKNIGTFGKLGGAINGADGALSGLPGGFGKLTGALVSVLPLLIGAGAELFALASALAPIAGLSVGAGAGLLALAQGAVVLALAFAGVGDALKEQLKLDSAMASQAIQSAAQQRAAAQAIAAAQEGVRTAKRGVEDAARRVEDAERDQKTASESLTQAIWDADEAHDAIHDARSQAVLDLQRLQDTMDDAVSSELRAVNELATARHRLTTLQTPDVAAVRRAHEQAADAAQDEAQAVRQLERARLDLDRLMKGAAPEDLEAAQEQIEDAARAEQRALLDLEKVREKTLGTDADKVDAALKFADAEDAATDAARRRADAEQALSNLQAGPADPKALVVAHEKVDDAVRAEQRALADLEKLKAAATQTDREKSEAALHLADAEDAASDAAKRRADAAKALEKLKAGPSEDDQAAAVRRVADAQHDVEKAIRAREQATKAIQDVERGGSAEDRAQALADIEEAQRLVARAIRERTQASQALTDAKVAGIDGSDRVREAEERAEQASRDVIKARRAVADAERAVQDARRDQNEAARQVALAERAVSDAHRDAASNAAAAAMATGKLTEKFDALSPAAQAFVLKLKSLKPAMDTLRATAGAGLFPGITSGIDKAMGSFTEFNTVTGRTARALGGVADKTGALLGSASFGRDFQTVGTQNAKVLGILGDALVNVIDATRHLLVESGPLTEWMARVVLRWTEMANASAKTGRETGKLAGFFDTAKARAQLLGSILANVASAIFGMGKASDAVGERMLYSLDRLTERWATWANSARGRNEIAAFMDKANDAMKQIWPALGAIIKGFTNFAMNVLPAYAKVLSTLGPYLDEFIAALIAMKVILGVTSMVVGLGKALMFLAANPVALVIVAVAALAAGLFVAYQKSDQFRQVIDQAAAAVQAFVDNALAEDLDSIQKALDNVTAVLKMFGELVLDVAERILPGLIQALEGWAKLIRGIVQVLAGVLTGDFGKAWDGVKNIFSGALDVIIGGLRAATGPFREAAAQLGGKVIEGIESLLDKFRAAGGWVTNRIIEGLKGATSLVGTVGGWLANRVRESVEGSIDGFKGVGGWVTNRLADGIRTVTELLGTVGGWLKNRIVELVQAVPDAYIGTGTWIVNRVVDGFTTVTKPLEGVGGWIKNRFVELIEKGEGIKDAFLGIGKTLIGWIVDGIEAGIKTGMAAVAKFALAILNVIDKIPGVNLDGPKDAITNFAKDKNLPGFARGGAYGRTGGVVDSPITLMGEEAPRHPEYVIPTNPAYRGRAQMLAMQAAQAVGLYDGGVVDAFHGAVKTTKASPKASLALFEAGIVESGLRNLSYGDRDSRGALQIRDSTARGMGIDNMNPGQSALAFLTRGFWGKGSAMQLAAMGDQSAGWVAQQTQGSAFPDRYDQVRDQAAKFLKGDGGGLLGALTGAISGATGIMGDLLSKGASVILDKLPNPKNMLPSWLHGFGGWMIDKVTGWVKDKVGSLVGDGGAGKLGGDLPAGFGEISAMAAQFGTMTGGPGQGHRPGDPGYHGSNRARDYSGGNMGAFAKMVASRFGSKLLELIYTPLGWGIKNGQKTPLPGPIYDAAVAADHYDHVHVAMAKGGKWGGLLGSYENGTDYVPQTGPYLLHRGEAVKTRAENSGPPVFNVKVFIGDREITDIVRTEIREAGREDAADYATGWIQ